MSPKENLRLTWGFLSVIDTRNWGSSEHVFLGSWGVNSGEYLTMGYQAVDISNRLDSHEVVSVGIKHKYLLKKEQGIELDVVIFYHHKRI